MTTTGDKVLAYLERYAVKKDNTGGYRFNSPFRAGANSHSCSLTIEAGGEHGAWQDFNGGDKGSLYDLAQRLGISLPDQDAPTRAAVDDTMREYRNLAEYAQLKGVPESVFLHAKWSAEPTTYENRPALTFPTAGGLRYRFLDGKKPKFKSHKGYKVCWYGLKPATAFAHQQHIPLVLCNGEPSVIVAFHFKVAACAITSGEQPTIPAPLLNELKQTWDGEIIIALDCDPAGHKSAAGKAEILRAAGFKVKVVDLGLGEKGDLADFCKLHTEHAMQRLLELPDTSAAQPVNLTGELPNLLKELAAARRQNDPKTDETLPVLLDKIQTELDRSRVAVQSEVVQSFASLVSIRHKRLDAAMKNPNKIQGMRSGIQKLDNLIGGFVPGRIYTLYGDTGMGKSTCAASIVANFIGQAGGCIISTESMPGDYLDKIAAYKANVNFEDIETGIISPDNYREVMAVYSWLEEKNCHFLDSLAPSSTLVRSVVREGMKQYGYQWALIDSVNNVVSSDSRDDLYSKTTEAADLAQELSRMGLVVLITTQIGRNMKGRKNKIPKKNDALGSGKIEQNSDVIMALYNHEHYVREEEAKPDDRFPPGSMLVKCLKHRQRGGAEGKGVLLAFKGGIGVYD